MVLVLVLVPIMPACARYRQHGNNPGHSAPNKLLQLRGHLSHGVGPKLQAALGMALGAEAKSNRFVKFVGVERHVRGRRDETRAA